VHEPLVQDNLLTEQWYSLGKYNMAVDSGQSASGQCGTKYPVYLTGDIFTLSSHISQLNI